MLARSVCLAVATAVAATSVLYTAVLAAPPAEKGASQKKAAQPKDETASAGNKAGAKRAVRAALGEAKAKPDKARLPAFTPEREAAALTLVRLHHPELSRLLEPLKSADPAEYELAIRELFRTSERLAQTKERDPELYELELEAWKAQSRIRLLLARVAMADDQSLRESLKKELTKQLDVRVKIVELQRRQAQERLTRLDTDLERLHNRRDEQVKKQLETLLRDARRNKPDAAANEVSPTVVPKQPTNSIAP